MSDDDVTEEPAQSCRIVGLANARAVREAWGCRSCEGDLYLQVSPSRCRCCGARHRRRPEVELDDEQSSQRAAA